jgi:hypothetical protein
VASQTYPKRRNGILRYADGTAGQLTLKAGDSDTAQLASLPPFCASGIWGTNGTYDVVYDITLKDAASGTPLPGAQGMPR